MEKQAQVLACAVQRQIAATEAEPATSDGDSDSAVRLRTIRASTPESSDDPGEDLRPQMNMTGVGANAFPFADYPQPSAFMIDRLAPDELVVEADLVVDNGITFPMRCLMDTGAQASTLAREIYYTHFAAEVPLEPATR